jgi:hypothetical protein
MRSNLFARSGGKPYPLTILTPAKRLAGGFHFFEALRHDYWSTKG